METITVHEANTSFHLYDAEVGKFAAFAITQNGGYVISGICVEDTLEECKKAAQRLREKSEEKGEDWSGIDIGYYLIVEGENYAI